MAIVELRKYLAQKCNWTCERIAVYCTIHADGTALSAQEKMKNRMLLNSASSNVLPWTTFMDILKSVLDYASSFHDSY